MMIEIDDDFSDDIVRVNLAECYVDTERRLKNGGAWHEDDVAAWKEILPALKLVGGWYSVNFDADIKKARKR